MMHDNIRQLLMNNNNNNNNNNNYYYYYYYYTKTGALTEKTNFFVKNSPHIAEKVNNNL